MWESCRLGYDFTKSSTVLWGQIDVINEQGRDTYAKHGRYEEQEQQIEFACLEFLDFLFLLSQNK